MSGYPAIFGPRRESEEAIRRRKARAADATVEPDVEDLSPRPDHAALLRAIANPRRSPPSDILALQRTVGNGAVRRLIQAKLAVSSPGDPAEIEAERVAEQVMSTPVESVAAPGAEEAEEQASPRPELSRVQAAPSREPAVETRSSALSPVTAPKRQGAEREADQEEAEAEEEEEPTGEVNPKTLAGGWAGEEKPRGTLLPSGDAAAPAEEGLQASDDLERRIAASQGSGGALPDEVRSFMEPRLGADFSGVRVHTDAGAAEMADELAAQAFTHGQDVYMAEGKYSPGTDTGKRLLAHELAHVVQQGAAPQAEAQPSPSAILQRAPTKVNNASINAGHLDVTNLTVTPSGTVLAQPSGDQVTIIAPEFSVDATVSLKTDVELEEGSRVDVGPVQSLMSSDRVGVYRQGGAGGKVLFERHMTHGGSRDAAGELATQNVGAIKAGEVVYAPGPWYKTPQPLSSSIQQVGVSFKDQPKFPALPRQQEGGVLTETRGQDNFILSIAAQPEGQGLIYLKKYAWSVPWNVTIDPSGAGTGQAITSAETNDIPAYTTGEPTNTIPGQDWLSFPTLEAAMAASPSTLMANLVTAKAADPTSWTNSVEALRRKNPLFRFQITAESTAAWVGGDTFTVQVTGHKTAQMGGLELNSEVKTCTAGFGLIEVLDPAAIDGSTVLKVELTPLGKTATWPYPFAAQGSPVPMVGGSGKYTITGSLV